MAQRLFWLDIKRRAVNQFMQQGVKGVCADFKEREVTHFCCICSQIHSWLWHGRQNMCSASPLNSACVNLLNFLYVQSVTLKFLTYTASAKRKGRPSLISLLCILVKYDFISPPKARAWPRRRPYWKRFFYLISPYHHLNRGNPPLIYMKFSPCVSHILKYCPSSP